MKMNLKKAHKLVASIKSASITQPTDTVVHAVATVEVVKNTLDAFEEKFKAFLQNQEIQNRLVFRIRRLISEANSSVAINDNTIDAALNEMEMVKVSLAQLQHFSSKPVARDHVSDLVVLAESSLKNEYADRSSRITGAAYLSTDFREEKFKETRTVKDKIEELKDYIQMANSTITIEVPFSPEEEEFLKEFAII